MPSTHVMHAWSGAEIVDALAAGLGRIEADLAREQAVCGIDSLDEVELHPHLARAVADHGFGVHREVRYPGARSRRNRSEGRRCDLVLTPDGRALSEPDAEATLFDDPAAVPLDEAFWLEVKTLSQFTQSGANASWSNELLATVGDDIAKLASDEGIRHGALLIVLFAASDEVVDHDLDVWQDRCLSRSLPIGAPWRRRMPVLDRLGNTVCSLSLYAVH